MKDKVLFLDLDHTLIRPKNGERFPKSFDDWEFIEEIKDNVIRYHNEGYKIIIVSNQGGIQAGHTTIEELDLKFETIRFKMGIVMRFLYASTNNKKDQFRKPNIGMFTKANTWFDIDKENSIMVGDASGLEGQFSDSDKKFAENSGIGTYYDVEEFKNK